MYAKMFLLYAAGVAAIGFLGGPMAAAATVGATAVGPTLIGAASSAIQTLLPPSSREPKPEPKPEKIEPESCEPLGADDYDMLDE